MFTTNDDRRGIAEAATALVRCVLTVAVVLGVVAVVTPSATAEQRTPRLQSSCPSGFAYGEHTFGALRIEGCSREAATKKRPDQRAFRGELELNGLLVSAVGTEEFEAWTDSVMERNGIRYELTTVGHLKRSVDTRLYLDANIGGQQVRFRIYSGPIHLQAASGLYVHQGVAQPPGTMDIPVNGAPALLGLRLRSSIEDAALDENGMTFPVALSLGSGAPELLREETGEAEIRLVDGSGMRVTGLQLHIKRIELPGIGGMRDLRIDYLDGRDRWRGMVDLRMGELFGGQSFEFELEVDGQSGVPLYIRLAVDDMNFPIGQSGIFLQGVRGEFGFDPLLVAAGATATAGPQVAGVALIEMGGDLRLVFEPRFRLEATGTARILPTGRSSQLGTGRIEFVYDAEGYVRIAHRQRYEALVLGVGPSAQIDGEGSYATDRNRFNVEASATGRLELGVLGGFDVVRLGAVVSSNGWGTCGSLAPQPFGFVTGGIGQDWDRGMTVLMGCDLEPFTAEVRAQSLSAATGGFVVPRGQKKFAVAVRADAPGPRFRLTAPGGRSVDIEPTRGTAGPFGGVAVGWLGSAASDTTYVFLRKPPAGRWRITTADTAPAIVGVRTARTAPAVKAEATVQPTRQPGVRRLSVRVRSGLAQGDRLLVSVVGPSGAVPVGLAGRRLSATFPEAGSPGSRRIVGQVVRDGVPLPGRTVVLGRYRATLPAAPATVRVKRVGRTPVVRIVAVARRGAERPDEWSYVVRGLGRQVSLRAVVGRPVTVRIPARTRITVAVRPVVGDRVLPKEVLIRRTTL